jgi:hypothetical protein
VRSSRDDARMTHDGYARLRIAVDAGIARVTTDHPPLNLLDARLEAEDFDASTAEPDLGERLAS